jgi:hypothetical protein
MTKRIQKPSSLGSLTQVGFEAAAQEAVTRGRMAGVKPQGAKAYARKVD